MRYVACKSNGKPTHLMQICVWLWLQVRSGARYNLRGMHHAPAPSRKDCGSATALSGMLRLLLCIHSMCAATLQEIKTQVRGHCFDRHMSGMPPLRSATPRRSYSGLHTPAAGLNKRSLILEGARRQERQLRGAGNGPHPGAGLELRRGAAAPPDGHGEGGLPAPQRLRARQPKVRSPWIEPFRLFATYSHES